MHTHKLIFIRSFLGDHKIYWCRECGLIAEMFGSNMGEMIPEWSRSKLEEEDRSKEKFQFTVEKIIKRERKLGRGIKDLLSTTKASSHLSKILKS